MRRKTSHLLSKNISTQPWEIIHNYSCLKKLLRITAWCFRYINNLRLVSQNSPPYKAKYLSAAELINAAILWIKQFQKFPDEYSKLSKSLSISQKSPIFNLDSVYDPFSECLK